MNLLDTIYLQFSANKKLKKAYKKHPDAFWMDTILGASKNSLKGRVAYNIKAIDNIMNGAMQTSKGQLFYDFENTERYFFKLVDDGMFRKDKDHYFITEKAIQYLAEGGYIKDARKKHKEKLKFEFEFFKIGYDTIISLLALILSIIALAISLSPE